LNTTSAKVHVVIPMHNGEKWLAESVESVMAQTYADWHLTLVDDFSRDQSRRIASKFADAHPEKVSLSILPSQHGAPGARMKVIETSRSQYIAFLDQDDRWCENKLERQVAVLAADPSIKAIHADIEVIDDHGSLIAGKADQENAKRSTMPWGRGQEVAIALFKQNRIRIGTAVVHRESLLEAGGFDPTLFGGEDWEFWVRFSASNKLHHLPEVVAQRRIHASNTSTVFKAERTQSKLVALNKLEANHDFLRPYIRDTRKKLQVALGRRSLRDRIGVPAKATSLPRSG